MSRERARIDQLVRLLAAAYVAGVAALVVLIAVVDSRLATGAAVGWIILVLLYARHALRCPLCGASVLNAPVGAGLSWLTGRDRRCPRCKTDYESVLGE